MLGLAAVFITHDTLVYYVGLLTRNELLQDPGDAFANFLVNAAAGYSVSVAWFVAAYLLIHGVAKLLLVTGLLQRKLKVYPSAMIVFTLFVIYQIYEYVQTQHVSLLVLSVIDIVIVVLTYLEYRSLQQKTDL